MKIRLILLATITVAAVLCQSQRSLAVQVTDIRRWQMAGVVVRDFIGDPGMTSNGFEVVNGSYGSEYITYGVSERWLASVPASRINPDTQQIAWANSITQIDFSIGPFGHHYGNAAIFQTVQVNPYPGAETYARVGVNGDGLAIEFLVDESEGDVELSAKGAWTNFDVWGNLSLFQGGAGWVTVDDRPLLSHGIASIRLSPGIHTLGIVKYGFDSGPYSRTGATFGHMLANWTFDGVFPGDTPHHPHFTVLVEPKYEINPLEPVPALPAAAMQLAFPVLGGVGLSSDVYAGLPTAVFDGPYQGALITGFELTSEFTPFTSFVVPELPAGGGNLTIDFGSGPQAVVAGQTVDFGPTGISSFSLSGFDPLHASEQRGAMIMGLRFAAEGAVSILAVPVLYTPPGDFDENGFVDGNDFLLWQQQAGALVALGTGIDVVADGVVDEQDLSVWYAYFGEPNVSAPAGLSVPEPCTLALVALAATGYLRRLRLRR